jgi:hypothetical protein
VASALASTWPSTTSVACAARASAFALIWTMAPGT